jgi:antitoxin ParD1/3/4
MATMNVSLPDDLKRVVESRVRSGLYANASDYIRDLVRSDQARDDWVVDPATAAAIDEAEREGLSDRSVADVFAEARASFVGQ